MHFFKLKLHICISHEDLQQEIHPHEAARKGTHALLLHTQEPGQQQRPAVGTLCSVCLRTQLSQQQLFNSLQEFSAFVELALQVQLAQCRSEYVHVC